MTEDRQSNQSDIGVGPGTTAIATLDFLRVWGQACILHEQPFPVTSFGMTLLDKRSACLTLTRDMLAEYSKALRTEIDRTIAWEHPDQAQMMALLEQLASWCESTLSDPDRWVEHDVAHPIPPLQAAPDLVVMAHVLIEIRAAECVTRSSRNIHELLFRGQKDCTFVVLESAERTSSEDLDSFYWHLCDHESRVVPVLPIPQEPHQLSGPSDTRDQSRDGSIGFEPTPYREMFQRSNRLACHEDYKSRWRDFAVVAENADRF